MLVAVNNGMQCFGLIAIMPPLLKFLSLRHVWPLSLFMAFVSRNGHAIVTNVMQMVVCSFFTPASAAFPRGAHRHVELFRRNSWSRSQPLACGSRLLQLSLNGLCTPCIMR